MNFTKNFDKSAKCRLGKTYYYEVALSLSLRENLIYSSNQAFQNGDSVLVTLKSRKRSGVVLKEVTPPLKKAFDIKPILSVDPNRETLSSARLKWLFWLAEYYQHSLGSVIHLSFPPSFGVSKKGASKTIFLESVQERASRLAGLTIKESASKPSLTGEQKKCLEEIKLNEESDFRVHLLHGVTGSGKTEIYLRLVEPALQQGKSVLILVPEIALTPQHIQRFSSRFPEQVACFHSGLSPREKHRQWMSVLKGEKKILIGPRSALFCPLPGLSWIIVDEEHEPHFKQEEKLKYHGRDAAVYLGKCLNIPVILASATPSMESWWNAPNGEIYLSSFKKKSV